MLTPSETTSYERNSNTAAGLCAGCDRVLDDDEKPSGKKSPHKFMNGAIHADFFDRLHYNPGTGIFTWLKDVGGPKGKKGMVAGSLKKSGYVDIRFNGPIYKAHRLAWFYHYGEWPDKEIDHVNGVKSDNRIENLRLATRADNVRNIGRRRRNTSGYKGVSRTHNKWQARITVNRKIIYIGVFDNPERAYEAYCKAAEKLHGSFANTDNNPPFLRNGGGNG